MKNIGCLLIFDRFIGVIRQLNFDFLQIIVGHYKCAIFLNKYLFISSFSLLFILTTVSTDCLFAQATNKITSQELYSAYKAFKDNKTGVVTSLLASFGFEKVTEGTYTTSPGCSIDSLSFVQNESKVIFTMTDLGYLKNVSASISIKTDNPEVSLSAFEQILMSEGLDMRMDNCLPTICAEFQTNSEFWIVDKRWDDRTYTRFESLYHHVVASYDNYFVVNFNETIPEEWVTRDLVPRDQLGIWDESFMVVASSGPVQLKDSEGRSFNLRSGMPISKGLTIETQEGAYLALVSDRGQTFEQTGQSVLDVDNLKIGEGGSELKEIRELVDYVMNTTLNSDNLSNGMLSVASRDASEKSDLKILLPDKTVLIDDEASIQLTTPSNNPDYIISIENLFNQVIWQGEGTGNSFSMDLGRFLNQEGAVFVQVQSKNNPELKSKKHLIRKLVGNRATEFRKKILALSTELKMQSSIDQIALAGLYEKSQLIIEASVHYQKAMELSPGVKYYESVYDAFLRRTLGGN